MVSGPDCCSGIHQKQLCTGGRDWRSEAESGSGSDTSEDIEADDAETESFTCSGQDRGDT